MFLQHPRHLALIAAALYVAGCAQSTPPESPAAEAAPAVASTPASPAVVAPDTATTLVAYQWQLTSAIDAEGQSIAALFPVAEQPLGIQFSDGRLNVSGGCNRISAGYQLLDSAQMQVSQGMSTMMACPPPLGDADAAFAKFLAGTLQVAVEGEPGAPQLRLTAANGNTLTFSGTATPETRFGGPGTRAFLEVSLTPCEAPATPRCLMVRDRHFDASGIAGGTPGEWRALPDGIENYEPVDGQQQVVRVMRFEQASAAGSAPTEHFVLDLIIETRTVQ